MNIRVIKWSILLGMFAICTFAVAKVPENLTDVKKQIIQYHDTGNYDQDFAAAIKEALYYLKFRISQNNRSMHPKKLAIILAIDETALSNYSDMVHMGFGGTSEEVSALQAEGHDPAIPFTLKLYNYAKNHGVAVFFVTYRKEYERVATLQNLQAVGYHGWTGLFMEPNDYTESSATDFKTKERHKIMMMGYDIALNISGQQNDLLGGMSDMIFKLPNPYY